MTTITVSGTVTGGSGADIFVFASGSGAGAVTDFSAAQGDRIDLAGFAGLTSFAQVQAAATLSSSGTDTVITAGSDSLTLQNVLPSSLTASDFLFGYAPTNVHSDLTIAAGQTLTFTGSSGGLGAYDLSGPVLLKLGGTMLFQDSASNDALVGVQTQGTSGPPTFWIAAGATMTLTAQGSGDTACGFYAGVNAGFENDGTLSVSATGNASAVVLNDGGVFTNSGTITANSADGAAYGVAAGDNVGGISIIENTGTITAEYAISAISGSGYMVVSNSGTLNGQVVLGPAAGNAVANTGHINGSVIFDGTTGQQVYDGRGGALSGGVAFASGANITGTDVAYLGNDGETAQGGSAAFYAYGGTGADHITGGPGDSVIDGGGGNDVLDGGTGHATVVFASAASGVTVSLALQGQAQNTGYGVDTLTHFQNLTGSAFNDTLEGDGGDNVLDGGGGTNTVSYAHAAAGVTVSLALQGQAQNTVGAGSDTLFNFQALVGSAYNDTLEGGGSASTTLTGGLGADTFVYRAGDGNVTVTDFSDAQGDKIDLSHLGQFFSLSDVLAEAMQVGADTVIGIGGGSLTLKNVSMSALTASDFSLSAASTVGPGVGGTPTTGSGTINGTSGDDWLQGGAGNDILHGGAGSDYLDGGAGLNTALYDGVYRQYVVSPSATAVSGGPEGGTDILTNIQRIQFVDGYLATSPTDTAGEVYRLYEATLGRAPDQEGLTNWTNALNSGTSLQSVADGFVGSQEFQAAYGANLSNHDFVSLLYENVLHREPDSAGLTNWVGLLNSGQDTRAQVVLGLSESQENIAASAPAVEQGLWVGDPVAGEVARLYDAVFGRLPDASGLANWTHALEGGASLQSVADGFVGSQEFQTAYGSLDNNGFVTLLYHNVLHREPDSAGLTSWVGMLNSGQDTRAQVVVGFSESAEHVANMAPYIDNGVWVLG